MKAVYEKPTLEVVDLGLPNTIAATQCTVAESNLFHDSGCKIIIDGDLDDGKQHASGTEACDISGYCYQNSANIVFGS